MLFELSKNSAELHRSKLKEHIYLKQSSTEDYKSVKFISDPSFKIEFSSIKSIEIWWFDSSQGGFFGGGGGG